MLWERLGGTDHVFALEWLSFGETTIRFGIEVNSLNALMLLIVSLVGFLVQVYSRGYMMGDGRVPVFYAYLSLFTFSMLGLVLSPNLLQLYIFWELVGACSFLLIGFWYFKPEAKRAAKKAFIVTRIGDIGLLIGVILTFVHVGSFEFAHVFAAVGSGRSPRDGDTDQPAPLCRGCGKIRSVSLTYLVAGCHGGPHSGQCFDSRGDDGGGGGLAGRRDVSLVRLFTGGDGHGGLDRGVHGDLCGRHRAGPI